MMNELEDFYEKLLLEDAPNHRMVRKIESAVFQKKIKMHASFHPFSVGISP